MTDDAPSSSSPEPGPSGSYVRDLQEEFAIPGFIDFLEGQNGLPRIWIQHPSGQCCEIYLQGANITRWVVMLHVGGCGCSSR